jgi:hypothetical protein
MSDKSKATRIGEGCGKFISTAILYLFILPFLYVIFTGVKRSLLSSGSVESVDTTIVSLLIALGFLIVWLLTDAITERIAFKIDVIEALDKINKKNLEG